MKSIRKNRKELLVVALAAIALGVFNFAVQRFIGGTLCIMAGISVLLIWTLKRNT